MTISEMMTMATEVEAIKKSVIATECRTLEGAAKLSAAHGHKHVYEAAELEARKRWFANRKGNG